MAVTEHLDKVTTMTAVDLSPSQTQPPPRSSRWPAAGDTPCVSTMRKQHPSVVSFLQRLPISSWFNLRIADTKPFMLAELADVGAKHVASGGGHVAIITESGQLMTWGENKQGQLGLGNRERAPAPTVAKIDERVVDVACGYQYTLVLTESGRVLEAGKTNVRSSRNSPDLSDTTPTFRVVPGLEDVPMRSVSAGFAHAAGISRDGALYTWGRNHFGQLGTNDNTGNLSNNEDLAGLWRACKPVVPNLESCRLVTCGQQHTVALTETGSVVGFGRNANGQLVLPLDRHSTVRWPTVIATPPTKSEKKEEHESEEAVLELPERVVSLAAGYDHTCLITESGRAVLVGGKDSTGLVLETSDLEGFTVTKIAFGPSHCVFC
eukprot:c19095_g1_i2.p1 GENE.c19095_g1_i2~~c19095_g1_i2.p1  ORF type:complete len:378 (+),score=68.31 c19095_g1_i2:112-1245(+)